VNRNEPQPPLVAAVEAPDYLDADARKVWDRLAPSLVLRGVLTAWDVDLFGAYCTAVVHHRRAVQLVNATNPLLKRPDGPVKHPGMQVIRDQVTLMTAIGGRFGLTPSDRSSISLPEQEHGSGSAAAILD
jgi:P27 family predicted phage terminase small subunit